MTRIAFYLDTDAVHRMDISDVDAGNPGMGGSEYLFFLIAKHLAERMEVHFYATRLGAYPDGVAYHEVKDFADAVRQFQENGEKWVILREGDAYAHAQLVREAPQQFVAWAHNYSNYKRLRFCERTANVVRYLCVSREQYENLRDEAVFPKCDYVFNTAVAAAYPCDLGAVPGNAVFYMGSVIPIKGFHVLAAQWQAIRRAVPDATLHIVGSGQLYDRNIPMGPLGIATAAYERRFARYIASGGVLREDVIFHGALGAGKHELLRQAKVAVVNPTGLSETFCLSALEFELLGVPVVTKDLGGPRNVVQDGRTGILYRKESQLGASVVRLLRDEGLRAAMSRNAVAHGRTFDIAVIVRDWERLIRDLEAGAPAPCDYRITEPDRLKGAKELNRKLKALPGLGWLPSVDRYLHILRKKQHSLFVKPWQRLMGYGD
jgi:glycosyltransferase involved in cell wall biosynthesis